MGQSIRKSQRILPERVQALKSHNILIFNVYTIIPIVQIIIYIIRFYLIFFVCMLVGTKGNSASNKRPIQVVRHISGQWKHFLCIW